MSPPSVGKIASGLDPSSTVPVLMGSSSIPSIIL